VRVSVWLPSTPQTETVAYWDSAAIHWAIRCQPQPGDYNFYIYAYVREGV
jgi:hypothetical protein